MLLFPNAHCLREIMTAGKLWTCKIIWSNHPLFSYNCLMQNTQGAYKRVIKSLPSWGRNVEKAFLVPRKTVFLKLRNEKSLSSRIYCNFSDCKFQPHYRQTYKSCSWKYTQTHTHTKRERELLASEITLGGRKHLGWLFRVLLSGFPSKDFFVKKKNYKEI